MRMKFLAGYSRLALFAPETGAGTGAGAGAGTGAGAGPGAGGTVPNGSEWAASLAPELQQVVTAKGWKAPADALASYVALERTIGADKIVLPGKDAKPEDWAKWDGWAKLGRPESAEKYDLGDWKAPAGWNEAAGKTMLGEFHAAGLNSTQAQRLLGKYAELRQGEMKALETAAATKAAEGQAALKGEWKGEYDAKLALANRAVRSVFGEGVKEARGVQLADGTFLLDHPGLAKAFAAMGATLAEDGSIVGQGGGGAVVTAGQAKAEIARLQASEAYTNPKHAEYGQTHARVLELYGIAAGGQQA